MSSSTEVVKAIHPDMEVLPVVHAGHFGDKPHYEVFPDKSDDSKAIGIGLTAEDAVENAARRIAHQDIWDNPPAPKHPFEVRINIGGDDWDYVVRTLEELAIHIKEHGPECCMCSGGGGGSHSVDIRKRDVSAEQFRAELSTWFDARREAKRVK